MQITTNAKLVIPMRCTLHRSRGFQRRDSTFTFSNIEFTLEWPLEQILHLIDGFADISIKW